MAFPINEGRAALSPIIVIRILEWLDISEPEKILDAIKVAIK